MTSRHDPLTRRRWWLLALTSALVACRGPAPARTETTPAAETSSASTTAPRVATGVDIAGTRSCLFFDDGTQACWGERLEGAFAGRRVLAPRGTWTFDADAVAGGTRHGCVLTAAGDVRCWGLQLQADSEVSGGSMRNPALIQGVDGAGALASGGGFHIVLGDAGQVYRLVYDDVEGSGERPPEAPVTGPWRVELVDGLSDVTSVAARGSVACATRADATTWCWGTHGRLGVQTARPVEVAALTGAHDLAFGGRGSVCQITTEHELACTGRGRGGGVLGLERTGGFTTFVPSGPWRQVEAADDHACARHADGTVWCWGDNRRGLVGVGSEQAGQLTSPVQVPGIADAVDIAVGPTHSCALMRPGGLVCWGRNGRGQLGTGDRRHHATPVEVRIATGLETTNE